MAEEHQQAAPVGGGAALLIVGMSGDGPGAGSLALKREAVRTARAIATLREAAMTAGVPVIFVNDAATPAGTVGAERRLRPAAGEHVVVKTQFSGFHATPLAALLERLGVGRLILTGIATDIAIMFTAADAHMRGLALWVPEDAVAGTSAERHRWALELMRQSMAAETHPTSELSLSEWIAGGGDAG